MLLQVQVQGWVGAQHRTAPSGRGAEVRPRALSPGCRVGMPGAQGRLDRPWRSGRMAEQGAAPQGGGDPGRRKQQHPFPLCDPDLWLILMAQWGEQR